MISALSRTDSGAADLSSCDREPIHLLGNVQAFGCLISVSTDWLINHVSVNVDEILGLDAPSMVGARFASFFPEGSAHRLRGKTQTLGGQNAVTRCFAIDVFEDGRLFDISIQATPHGYAFEFEPKRDIAPRDDLSIVQSLVARLRAHSDLPAMAGEAVRGLRGLTGFDRVMVYRFAPDGTGSVIAEACDRGDQRYLGLRFPASDIPSQARALYKRNLLRLISDVDGAVHPIIPTLNPEGAPPDLSTSVTRAVSPVHLEYLRNMGVGASMSVSIMRRGELWGLMACHHKTPHYIDYEMRTAVELFVQLFSYELSELLNEESRVEANEAKALHDRLMARVTSGKSIHDDLGTLAEEISDVIAFDGIAVFSGGVYRALGSVPTEAEFMSLVRFLNTTAVNSIFATDHLGQRYPRAGEFLDRAAGLLVLPISRQPRDYIVLFRREVTQVIKWAGEPVKRIEESAEGTRLTPRTSFEAWREVVKGKCAPWTESELAAARALRVTLVEVVLKVTDLAGEERLRAQQKQELLIAELNHRVRNILNLISGIVVQGRSRGSSLEAFAEVLDGRIQSLARAHDQLTGECWSPVSLKTLINTEFAAYTDMTRPTVHLVGEDVLVMPEAVSTLVLVLHELVTNAVKHGALSGPGGVVEIDLSTDAVGALIVAWRETGGPPVQAPGHMGFGSTIIENSVPFELKGRVETRFRTAGLEVDITVPEAFCEPVAPSAPDTVSAEEAGRRADGSLPLSGEVLVLEDNLVIAMHAEDLLRDLGAEVVHVANSVTAALEILDSVPVTFAVLDVNLGNETSVQVARRLASAKVPFILATGYGTKNDFGDVYPVSPILKKPYHLAGLHQKVGEAFETSAM